MTYNYIQHSIFNIQHLHLNTCYNQQTHLMYFNIIKLIISVNQSSQMKPLLFQTDQINCNCFSTSPIDKPKIFLTKNQSLIQKSNHQSLKKQSKSIYTPSQRNQSESSKNKKKSLKKEKPSTFSQTSRNLIQQNEPRSNKNQQKQKQFLSITNLQSRRHSQSEKEHQRNISNSNQFIQPKMQNYKNFQNIQNINQNFQLKLNHNANNIQQKQQKHIRNFRQPHSNQINPFNDLQQFHLMQLNKKKSVQKQKQKLKERAFSHRQTVYSNSQIQDVKNRNQPALSSIQWKNGKTNDNFNEGSFLIMQTNTLPNHNFSFGHVATQKHQPIWSQRKQFNMNISTRANFDELHLKNQTQYGKKLENQNLSIDRNNCQLQHNNFIQNQHIQKQLSKKYSKSSTRKQSISSKHRDNINLQHHQQNLRQVQIQQNIGHKLQKDINFQNILQNNNHHQQFCHSPVRARNSFRGSKVSYKEKQSITKKLNQKRMMPKQIQSVDDQNQDNMSQISEVVGRGWQNYDIQNDNEDGENSQAIKNRKQFKTLTLFTRQSELNSKTNTKASQIKTGTQHSIFLSPKSQQIIRMHQFPLVQQGIGAYDLSYKNIGNFSQIKNKQCLLNKNHQAQKSHEHSLQQGEHSASKNKKSRKSSLKHI